MTDKKLTAAVQFFRFSLSSFNEKEYLCARYFAYNERIL